MRIIVKTNVVEVLRRELRRASWRRERVALGTATDAYQPCDGRRQLARGILRALRDFETPVSIVTKSTLVVRDLDILQDLARLPETRVNFSLTTLDRTLWKALEPGTPPPEQRLKAMARLAEAGIPCGIFLAPILPGLTDDDESLSVLATAARDHGATSFWGSALRLAPGVKEHFLGVLAEEWPEQMARYRREYPRADASREYVAQLERRVELVRHGAGFPPTLESTGRDEQPRDAVGVGRQLALGL
jgi:DNA repair photolyase